MNFPRPANVDLSVDMLGNRILDIPADYRGRLTYQHNTNKPLQTKAHAGISPDDKYTYYADKNRQWPYWTNIDGAAYLLSAMKLSQKCMNIAQDRVKTLATQRVLAKEPTARDDQIVLEKLVKAEVRILEDLGDKMYSDKNNLKKEYVTWTQSEYQNPAFQYWYLRLKCTQRYTEGFAACERLYELGYFQQYVDKINAHAASGAEHKIKFSAMSLGGGPGFELIALRDYLTVLVGPEKMTRVEFIGLSLDIDEIWKEYVEALGLHFVQWDCKERVDGMSFDTLQAKIDEIKKNEALEQMEKDELISTLTDKRYYTPLDQSIYTALSTYDDNISKVVKKEDENTPISIDMTIISYAFLMYMSLDYQQDQLFSMLQDYAPQNIKFTPEEHISSLEAHLIQLSKDKEACGATLDNTAEQQQQQGKSRKEPFIFAPKHVIAPSKHIITGGILTLERVLKLEPLYQASARARRTANGVICRQIVRSGDDRQLFFYKVTPPQTLIQDCYDFQQKKRAKILASLDDNQHVEKQGNHLETQTENDEILTENAEKQTKMDETDEKLVEDNKAPISPFVLQITDHFYDKYRIYAKSVLPAQTLSRLTYPNVPYCDNIKDGSKNRNDKKRDEKGSNHPLDRRGANNQKSRHDRDIKRDHGDRYDRIDDKHGKGFERRDFGRENCDSREYGRDSRDHPRFDRRDNRDRGRDCGYGGSNNDRERDRRYVDDRRDYYNDRRDYRDDRRDYRDDRRDYRDDRRDDRRFDERRDDRRYDDRDYLGDRRDDRRYDDRHDDRRYDDRRGDRRYDDRRGDRRYDDRRDDRRDDREPPRNHSWETSSTHHDYLNNERKSSEYNEGRRYEEAPRSFADATSRHLPPPQQQQQSPQPQQLPPGPRYHEYQATNQAFDNIGCIPDDE